MAEKRNIYRGRWGGYRGWLRRGIYTEEDGEDIEDG